METYNPETPLPDSDIVRDETTVEVTVTATPPRRKWSHSEDFSVGTMTDGDTETSYNIAALPQKSRDYLAYFGLTVFLSRDTDPSKPFARLEAGNVGMAKVGRVAKVDDWRKAIALAFVDATKKAPNGQMSIEVATEKAMALDKEQFKALKSDIPVVRQYNKLTGSTVGFSVASLLAEAAA